jgi:hypothetical protein
VVEEAAEADVRKAVEEPLHVVDLEDRWGVRSVRALPKDVVEAVSESAAVHGIDAGMLMANLFDQVERQYYLSEGLSIYAARKSDGTSSGNMKAAFAEALSRLVPRDVRMPVHWNDFLGGVILAGKNGMGLFQIRPANVKRFPGVWARFGIPDANVLSDREIAYRLMDPRYNVEAWAVILHGMAQEVESLRLQALSGEDLDFSEYRKESKVWLSRRSADEYALLPPLKSVGADVWRLTAFHPLLSDKAKFSLDMTGLVYRSGIFDDRPMIFSGINGKKQVDKLAEMLKVDKDPYLLHAVRRTLEAVAADANHPQNKRAREILKAHPELSGKKEARLITGVALAAMAGTLGAASLKTPVSRRALLGFGSD